MNIRCCAAFLMIVCLVGAAAAEEVAPPSPAPAPAPPAMAQRAPDNAAGTPVPSAPPRYPSRRNVPPSAPAAERSLQVTPGAGGAFLVKFNNADLYEVIHTLGRVAGINYLIDPRVRGVVTVHTQGTMTAEEALELLLAILRVNGATAVNVQGIHHIVPMGDAKAEPLEPRTGAARDPSSPADGPVMRAFPLQFVAAVDMAKVIKPFLSAGGDATEIPRANMLLVTDTASNMEKHARLVNLFDADAFRTAGVKLFPLKFLDPEEMARSLENVFGALDFGQRGGKPPGINFVPIARMNALLAVTASPGTMESVDRWVAELDRAPSGASRTVRLYRVRNGKAKDIVDILEKLFPGKTAKPQAARPTEFKPAVAEGAARMAPGAPQAARAEPRSAEAPGPGKAEGEAFDIVLDEPMNALIIRGSASEHAAILDVLKTLDVYPRQVLLEVLIAEVQLDDALKLGIDWTYSNKIKDATYTASMATSAADLASGLKYVVDKTNRLTAAFRSLANDGKVSVLSSPSVISTNGKKSRIDVADQVPIVTGTVTNPGPNNVITETVEYRDVGIILAFTPFINDEGTVTLEIEQEVSDVKEASTGPSRNPTFFRRKINTNIIATQDRSIVLGGLVRERRERSRDGVPFLYKIPLIGWIFGSRSDSLTRTELLIFITPRVISSVEEGSALSREFEDRVQELKSRIQESKGIRPAPKADAPAQ